ncbi:hypothetical protein CBP34_08965 [Acidovorax carolinensis]|uniref:DUF2486 domain-containing protein n=2 Tax=Acidovorax carolinensis TaxID=553814 RepID=A0A240U1L2_9BURK|nr:hypothetical protein CBP34_08965 [Acidovorax carolinensis]
MSLPPKPLPRFVPTLTEVVQGPDVLPVSVPLAQHGPSARGGASPVAQTAPSLHASASIPAAPVPSMDKTVRGTSGTKPVQTSPTPRRPLPEGMEEYMVHRVMQRVDVLLDQRLREAIALVIQEQTRSVLPRLREEIESVVRHAVYEAVADELASGNPTERGR